MVINRRDMKRRLKGDTSTCNLLNNSPKRTKVHAQRKFAQGSNVSSPMITPVKEIEKQDKVKPDVFPEPHDLLPINRPHTEDFLTFLCFRGTSMLPPTLNFFNVAPSDSRTHSNAPDEDPTESCPPIANINSKSVNGSNEKPFIAFGVRKRADPVLVSKHMDKKRRHALALQALRRKYQEQKMAKIRAVTISKLSEKVSNKNSLVRTRSVTKNETVIKKNIPAKSKVKIVSTKVVKLKARAAINSTLRQTIKTPIRRHIGKNMCLRSYRGKFIQHELQVKKSKKPKIIKKKRSNKESSSDFSSDDDRPLLNTVKVKTSKVAGSKLLKKNVKIKKPAELNYRITRASSLFVPKVDQNIKRKIQISKSSIITKSPFVKLTPPKTPQSIVIDEKLKTINTKPEKSVEEFKQLKSKLDKPIEESKQLRSKLDKSIEESKQLKLKLDKSIEDPKHLKSKFDKSVEEPKHLKSKLDKSIEEPKQLKSKLDKSIEESKQLKSRLDKSIEEPKQLKGKSDKSIEVQKQLKSKLLKLIEEPKQLKSKSNKSIEDSKQLKSKSDKLIAQPKLLKSKLNKSIEEPKQLKLKSDKLIEEPKQLKSKLDKLIVVPKQLKSKLDNVIEEPKQLKSRSDKLIEEPKQLKSKLDKSIEEVKQLKSRSDKLIEEPKQLKSKLDKSIEEPKQLKSKLDKLDEEPKQLKPKLDKLVEEPKQLKSKLDKSVEEPKQLKSKFDKSVEEPKQLKSKLDKSVEESKQLKLKSDKPIEELKQVVKKSERDLRNLKRNDTNADRIIKNYTSPETDLKRKFIKVGSPEKTNKKSLIVEKSVKRNRVADVIKKIDVSVESNKKSTDLHLKKDDEKTENQPEKKTKRKFEAEAVKEKCDKLVDEKVNKDDKIIEESLFNSKTNTVQEKPAAVCASEKKLKKKVDVLVVKNVKTSKDKPEPFSPDEPKVTTQRPTRKTKEAAAIYMEILGHKLGHDDEIDDDDTSIDSFPELPNVRKTEQREIEMKARVKTKSDSKSKESDIAFQNEANAVKSGEKKEDRIPTINILTTEDKQSLKQELTKDLDKEDNSNNTSNIESVEKSTKEEEFKIEDKLPEKRTTRGSLQNTIIIPEIFSDSESESSKVVTKKDIKQTKTILKVTPVKITPDINKEKPVVNTRFQKVDNSEPGEPIKENPNCEATKKIKKPDKTPEKRLDNSFSDSDEEPLSKLALSINKTNSIKTAIEKTSESDKKLTKKRKSEDVSDKESKFNKNVKQFKKSTSEKVKQKEEIAVVSSKPKRECTKRPQNYVTILSSSEDEDQYFYGFVKADNVKPNKVTKLQSKCHTTPTADLLCKDVDKRFGKGKVNMSNEQIEKWLNDSALAENTIKKEDDELLKFIEKNMLDKTENDSLKELGTRAVDTKKCCTTEPKLDNEKPPEVISPSTSLQLKLADRKTIFNKERKMVLPSVNAFSANNESSVYAFEADTEDTVKTPFRRPTRRPSSTGTSRSEDSSKYDNSKSLKKTYTPAVVTSTISKNFNKQDISLTLSTDESNNSNSVSVHLDLVSKKVLKETRSVDTTTQNETEDGEKIFYIPFQPGKQSSSQMIQGVAVKLGTKNTTGQSQQVIMSAKLVTHTPVGAQKLIEKPLATSTPMYPPLTTIQKSKVSDNLKAFKSNINQKMQDRLSENSEEFKYKIPNSPSASSSSSTKLSKQTNIKSRMRSVEFCNPITTNEFPTEQKSPALIEAPVFHPNEKEFQDPLEYIEKIRPLAEKFGICRIVPPSTFKPECKVADDMRFTAYNQYVHKMLHRWGPNFKELMAISKYLKTQNIALVHPPWIGGMEIDLPRLYQIVQSLGGLKEVIEKKKWPKVSELMKIPKSAQDRVTKLDDIYCKYLLPYDTLSPAEREKLFDEVETDWAKRESRTLLKSQQKVTTLDVSVDSSDSESDDESEECIVKGRNMALNAFYRIARNTMSMWFKTMEPSAQEVEQEFWKHVTVKQNHICVHSGSIDCGNWGYGFSVTKNSPFARHAWNLKVLTNNSGSILRSLGPVMGVTVPTLHVGMVFSACCWYRDPHSLPWIEYLHTGGNKIWYGIPNSMSEVFHKAMIKLVPNYCRNKALWLPSDTAMVPPSRLVENGVSLCRTIQQPGQFIVVFPKAFTSCICTGYVVSESVYFAPPYWLLAARSIFDDLQESCEPSMFSFEKLIMKVASDTRSNVEVLKQIIPIVYSIYEKQKVAWEKLQKLNLIKYERIPLPEVQVKKKKKLQNHSGDYECEVCSKNLFISWVMDSDDIIYCLQHSIEYIEDKKIEAENCTLMYMYNNDDLINLIQKVRNTVEMKLQKKVAGKSVATF